MPPIWDGVLFNTSELKVRIQQELQQQQQSHRTSLVPWTCKTEENNISPRLDEATLGA